jgi:hypothetical protein
MKRYIWLGDSKYGGSVFWDKKNEICLRSNKQGAIKSNGKRNSSLIIIIISIITISRILLKTIFNNSLSDGNIRILNILFFTFIFTIVFITIINLSFFGRKKDYEETTFDDALYAINSTGYLNNPLIFMLVNIKLKIMIYIFIILLFLFGVLQLYTDLIQFYSIIKVCLMILFFIIPAYIVYLVNFKKDNKLKL